MTPPCAFIAAALGSGMGALVHSTGVIPCQEGLMYAVADGSALPARHALAAWPRTRQRLHACRPPSSTGRLIGKYIHNIYILYILPELRIPI